MIKRCVKFSSGVAALAAGLLLSACAFDRDPAVLQDPLYKTGYSDGCSTGHTRVSGFKETIQRNSALYEAEENYRTGWGDGYASCGGQQGFDDRSVFNERRDNSSIRY
ncbi:MAG: hypothetical protein JJ939_15480 [Alphaproteobacteria bacterium]|nr:hypothetical protein [Alphaproteobacteria bacterium]MBO6629817.1 hypothetical protein [Alphaproteobacteria bacterium]MDF1625744.1 hypothetical protein [Parvibaculaceae bacterium]